MDFDKNRAAEPMDGRPQYGPVREGFVTAAIGEPGGPVAAMRAAAMYPPTTIVACIGYWYRCGCEIRGSAPFYGWQVCHDHESLVRDLPRIDPLTQFANGLRMTFEQAHQQLGWPISRSERP